MGPRKKSLIILGVVVGLFLITAVSAAAYFGSGNKLSLNLGQKRLDIVSNQGLKISFKNKNVGCCYPFCEEMPREECVFDWSKGGCNLIPDCEKGCCLPKCEEMSKTHCLGDFGIYPADNWVSGSCDQLEECEEGCCEFQCVVRDMPKIMCEHESTNGIWTKGQCNTGCCKTEEGFYELPEETCQKCYTGSTWEEGECPQGFYTTMSDTISGTIMSNVQLTQTVTIEAYTCGETPFSTWQGEITTETTGLSSMTGTNTDALTGPFTIPLSPENPTFSVQYYTAEVSLDELKMTIDHPIIKETLELKGEIKRGAPECEE